MSRISGLLVFCKGWIEVHRFTILYGLFMFVLGILTAHMVTIHNPSQRSSRIVITSESKPLITKGQSAPSKTAQIPSSAKSAATEEEPVQRKIGDEVVVEVRVERGDTFSEILTRAGIDGKEATEITDSLRKVFDVRRINVGQSFEIHFKEVDGKGFAYSYDVDFQRDIQVGNKFEVLYETYHDDEGRKIRDGGLIQATLTTGGQEMKIYRFTAKDGTEDFFNEKGMSVRKALLRTPVNGARITSGFGLRRHPILGYSKMHKGIDFGAPLGTPIYAAGDGVIEEIGKKGGYGNYVRLRHSAGYATAYGHISRFATGMKNGRRVKQGQVIAYVGSTGVSTGPHLHFEVHINGQQVNPAKVKTTPGRTLGKTEMAEFHSQMKDIDHLIASLPLKSQVASQD
ncbi:MAG: M23 family metallopeptidase [Proteobacteria bacterium]|nr:M23 family metallopeptidase [Pseudomonadota bacterium]